MRCRAVPDDDVMARFPAAKIRPVVNTVGAGDARYASFLHGYLATCDPYLTQRQTVVFAAWKVGGNGGAAGFLDAAALAQLAA